MHTHAHSRIHLLSAYVCCMRGSAEANLVCRLPESESSSRVPQIQIQIRMIGFVTGYDLTKMSRTYSKNFSSWLAIESQK
jgi:hypothetical protein